MQRSNLLLVLAACVTFFMSVCQVALGLVPEWSAAFGAPDALLTDRLLLLGSSLVVAAILAVLGLYGLSGAGVIRRLPLLRLGLLGIGLGFTLYGLNLVPQLLAFAGMLPSAVPVPVRNLVLFSVLLLAGVLYLSGLATGWKRLSGASPHKSVA
jgi:hypothetical protein